MSGSLRTVLDTNVLVSALISPGGTPRCASDLAVRRGSLIFSAATYDELAEVLARPRLQKFFGVGEVEGFYERAAPTIRRVVPEQRIAACRDPKDDKFLDAAVAGHADFLVSGDEDLLVLDPFRGVPVLTPDAFLDAAE